MAEGTTAVFALRVAPYEPFRAPADARRLLPAFAVTAVCGDISLWTERLLREPRAPTAGR